MGLFGKKKNTEEFEATKAFMVDMLQYDESRNTFRIKNGFNKHYIKADDIQTYWLSYGNKKVTRKNMGSVVAGSLVIGALPAMILAGTHTDEYISNLTLNIKANNKFYALPLIIGKMKGTAAQNILKTAEDMIQFIEEKTTCEE